MKKPIDPRCEPGHYYLLNNYNPGYFGNGNNAYTDTNANNTVFTIPPSSTPSIGDELIANNISWKYYGDQWNNYVPDPYQLNYDAIGKTRTSTATFAIHFSTTPPSWLMLLFALPIYRTLRIFIAEIKNGTLPAVSIVKPSGLVDGHPASSKLDLFEGFTKKIIDEVKTNPKLWNDTAIFITEDEGGGYYDSGYVQPLDFFGDGTRIPLIVVSKYTTGGVISPTSMPTTFPSSNSSRLTGRGSGHQAQPRQLPQPNCHGRQPLCADQQPGHRRPNEPIQLQLVPLDPNHCCRSWLANSGFFYSVSFTQRNPNAPERS